MHTSTIADNAQPRLARGVRLQSDSVTGNSVLLFPEGVLELNETAQEILARCDGQTVSEIIQALGEGYDVDPEMLATDVRETLADLRRRKLIELTT
jgi:pyrroloquinoline quinone biosynthesis protein D